MDTSSGERHPVEQLAEEFAARQRQGEKPSIEEYTSRYPDLAEEIRELFPALLMVEDLGDGSLAATGPHLAPGARATAPELQQLGEYRILREVGRGGMGVVYEAEQQALGRRVALKVLPPQALRDPQKLRRFEREARAAARLHHTNIVPVFGVGCHEGTHYYVMQFIQGLGLDAVLAELKRLRQVKPAAATVDADMAGSGAAANAPSAAAVAQALLTGQFQANAERGVMNEEQEELRKDSCNQVEPSLPAADSSFIIHHSSLSAESGRPYWQSVARMGIQAAEALAYAHGQGILHRDIKPSNLLLDMRGTVWVTDFGLAKAASDGGDLTHTGDIVGTIRYMAPERFDGQADVRSDLYSLGLTLYEFLVLQPAFTATDRSKLMHQVTHEDPTPPRGLNPEIPRDLETIVLKAMARDPGHRYTTATELAADLQRFVEDRPIRARRVSLPERFGRWCRRNPLVAVLVAAVALLLGLVTVVSSVAYVQTARALEQKEQERVAAQQARELADHHFALAKDAVEKYLSKVTDNPKLTQADFHQLRKELLETALPFFEKLVEEKSQDPELRAARGKAYYRLAGLREQMGDQETARADYRRALEILGPLVAEFPTVPHYRQDLAFCHHGYGFSLPQGDRAEAEEHYHKALGIRQQLVADFPAIPDHRLELAWTHNQLGILLSDLGRRDEAEAQLGKALTLREKLAADFPTVAKYHRDVAGTLNNLASLLQQPGQRTEAAALYERAIHYQEQALARDPQDSTSRQFQANHHNNLAWVRDQLGQWAEAAVQHGKAVAVREKLAADFPSVPAHRAMLAFSHRSLGILLNDLGRRDEAEVQHRKALALREKLAADFPTRAEYHRDVGDSLHNLASVLERTGQRTEALALYERARRQGEQALERDPQDNWARSLQANHHSNLGTLLAELGRRIEAEVHQQKALSIREKLTVDFSDKPRYRRDLAWSHNALGLWLADLGRWDEAEVQYRKALAIREELVTNSLDTPEYLIDRASSYATLGHLLRDRGRPQEALDWYAKVVAALEPILAKEARWVPTREALRDAHWGRARALDLLRRHAEAIQDWKRALELDDGRQRPVLQLGRAISRAHVSGDHRRALAEAEALAKDGDGPTLQGLARLCALASAPVAEGQEPTEAARFREQYALRAVELLRQAASKGHWDIEYLKEGTDLAPLRSRADFQQLLAEAEATRETSGK